MHGLLNIWKPAGPTSRDVVNSIQRVVKPAKVGHAGTLDPLASGVLVIAIGAATRLIEYVQRGRKIYRATFQLGVSSDTDDIESPLTPLPAAPTVTRAELESLLPRFLGQIEQVPPVYSAIKVDGRRAYDLARRGETVTLAARSVMIHQLEIVDLNYPLLQLHIDCGSGTYVRSLGRDLAAAVGSAAVMTALERTAVGPFTATDALRMGDEFARAGERDAAREIVRRSLQPLRAAVADWPFVTLTDEQVVEVRHGRKVTLPDEPTARELAALDPAGQLVALLTPRGPNQWGPFLTVPCA